MIELESIRVTELTRKKLEALGVLWNLEGNHTKIIQMLIAHYIR